MAIGSAAASSLCPQAPTVITTRHVNSLRRSCRRNGCVPRQRRQQPHRPTATATVNATSPNVADRFDAADWDAFLRGYQSQYVERSYCIEDGMVEGTIPAELEGTLLRNGPGLFEVGSQQISQPFDGDGMLAIFAFKNGRAFFANRYVRTEGALICV